MKVVSIAVSFFTETNLAASFLLKTESFVTVCLRFPCALPIAATAFIASSLVIFPPTPVPVTLSESMLFSFKITFANGEDGCDSSFLGSCAGAATVCVSSFISEAGFSVFTADPFADISIRQTTCPTFTTSPSSAFRVITPDCSAGSSSVALSESTSAIGWSFSTKSPSFTNQDEISTSVMDSPGEGTFISNIDIALSLYFILINSIVYPIKFSKSNTRWITCFWFLSKPLCVPGAGVPLDTGAIT